MTRPPEAVADAAVLLLIAKAGLREVFLAVSLAHGFTGQCVSVGGAVAQLELADGLVADATASEVALSDATAVGMVLKRVAEVVAGKLVHHQQAFSGALCLPLLVGQLPFLYFDVVFSWRATSRLRGSSSVGVP